MRVIAGSARRLLLKTVDGLDTRPTTDRIKETLFNILQPAIEGSVFLDLFSGSGAIGIEALSRGARQAVFVDSNKAAAACIRSNLEHTKLKDKALVFESDVITALRRLEGRNPRFDIIFMDPPYNKGHEKQVISYLASSPMVTQATLIIIEASKETDFSWLGDFGFKEQKTKLYKTNKHVFARREEV